jgi:hypothetical protein
MILYNLKKAFGLIKFITGERINKNKNYNFNSFKENS